MRHVLAVVCVALACATPAQAAPPGWSPLPRLLTPRDGGYTATLLPSGKVLVSGGASGSLFLASTELFDPATNTWASGPGMSNDRYGHTATRLKDGRVLVVEGERNPSKKTAEVFNPVTSTWTPTPDLDDKRTGDTATLLPDGNVLVAGGAATYQVYETGTNTWRAPKAAPANVSGATATLLPTGKVLIAGGTVAGASTAQTWLYDPVADAFTAGKPLGSPRSGHTATLLRNGRVLVAGGYDSTGGGLLSSAETSDPASGTWAPTGGMARTHSSQSATLLTDGRVLLVDQTSAEIYNPSTGGWGEIDAPAYTHYDPQATLLADGTVLVAGGNNALSGLGDRPSERWTPATTLDAPSQVEFGSQFVGSASAATSVEVTNTGSSPLFVDAVTVDGDYSLAGEHCSGAPVAPGGACTVDVRFGPVAAGERAGTLRVKANTSDREHAIALLGSGTARPVDPPPFATPTPVLTPAPVVPAPVPPKPVVEIDFHGRYSPSGLSRAKACSGRVTLELRRGRTVIDRAATRLDRRCRYAVTFSFRRTRIGKAKSLTVVARFHGNRYLGATTNRFTVRVP